MKIIFSPEFSGNVYVKPSDGKAAMMDTIVVNTIGLINLLELRIGIHYKNVSEQERLALYYDAVCKYMDANPYNVMASSFKTSGLSTAKAMFSWRDELSSCEWKSEGKEISERLAVLIGVESYFQDNDKCNFEDRLRNVIDCIKSQNLNYQDITIEMAVAADLLKPATKSLIDTLQSHKATITLIAEAVDTSNNLGKVRKLFASKEKGKIKLSKDDTSLQIWKFTDDRLACEYLTYNNMEDVDVWVNADNKQMDNWLMLMGKALTGSVAAGCTPQLTQLFVMGLGMFAEPLNVNTLIEWLNMPVHPLSKFFRSALAESIVTNGGYRNTACKEKIEQFIDGDFVYLTDEQKALPEEEQDKLRKKDKKTRQKQAKIFLPSLVSQSFIKTEDVKQFVIELSSWARQHILLKDIVGTEQWCEQLIAVSGMCDAFYILLCSVANDTIDYKTIDSWMSTIYEKGNYTNAIAECNCRTVVDSPAKIASVAGKTVWVGLDGDVSHNQECSFLYPSEKEQLIKNKYMTPWNEEAENNYYEQLMMTPLRMTSNQLILVVRERMDGEITLKHPLIVRLEQQIENIDDFVFTPSIDAKDRQTVEKVQHDIIPSELKINNAENIKWPDHLSPTTIGTLVEYPFDYLMEHLLNITNDGKASMADVKTTKGNVAHAVIERLFSPLGNKTHSTPEEIEIRILNDYESVYKEVLEAHGAILQLAENKLAEKLLHEQLISCLKTLLEILKENNLKVTGCEHSVEYQMGLGLPKAIDEDGIQKERDIVGFIDMTLEDKDGSPIVFDFKWTTWSKGYRDILKENRSVQLEFYRAMLGRQKKDEVKRVAYFLMPEARLYSQEKFQGKNCFQIAPDNHANIVEQLRQSALYRMEQINKGIVETNGNSDDLQYCEDAQSRNLFPLKTNEEGTKEENFFSQYKLFNK
ncbi:MAG: PD-(D/E)XK nuclease family protein [Paludibacteraceae bacterium]|nr:PD-(D/E)XK nuclease family protein [Paludibacteraceae bacterium]